MLRAPRHITGSEKRSSSAAPMEGGAGGDASTGKRAERLLHSDHGLAYGARRSSRGDCESFDGLERFRLADGPRGIRRLRPLNTSRAV
ncbi:hypothetical protein MRX96_003697 [Rhipicephalus microplus]